MTDEERIEKYAEEDNSAKELPYKRWLKIRSTQEILDNQYQKIQALESELAKLREALKKIIPIAEAGLERYRKGWPQYEKAHPIIEKAKKLIP